MRSLFAVPFLLLAACGALGGSENPEAQKLVGAVAQRYTEIVRLTLHAVPTGGSECRVIASTEAARVGRVSDKEDLEAMASGQPVVLEEPEALDVTVPILPVQGKSTAVVGVTLRNPARRDREAVVARAQEIAKAVAEAVQASTDPMW